MAEGDGKEIELRITNRDELKAFLDGRPLGDVVNISLRAVWRILPLVRQTENDALFRRLMLAVFRATLVAQRGQSAFEDAAIAASEVIPYEKTSDINWLSICVNYAAISCASAAAHAHSPYTSSPHSTASQFSESAPDAATDITLQMVRALDNSAQKIEHCWLNIEQDCRLLVRKQDVLSQRLWESRPGWFERSSEELFDVLKAMDTPWTLIETWFRQIQTDASVDPFPKPTLDDIANERIRFWGNGKGNTRSPDDVMSNIAERLGWPPRGVTLEGVTIEGVGTASGGDAIVVKKDEPPGTIAASLGGMISAEKEVVLNAVTGLISLCQAERSQIAALRPNSDDKLAEKKQKLIFFDKLKVGLKSIEDSLNNEPPDETIETAQSFFEELKQWYESQPDYIQKCIKLTGIGSFTFGLTSAGAMGLVAFPLAATMFAKGEVIEMLKLFPQIWKSGE